ncbi:aldo/keto reductase [Actinomadura gamaensis]|uniref:Aldo/keto reductase n=1 Tax=Actinomadura gamaensis TaxID=1763541 RepID=A0ABV9UA63_9ACTN
MTGVQHLRRLRHASPHPPDQVVDLDDQLAGMISLREAGKMGAIGLSSVTAEVLRRALGAGIVCVQNAYSRRQCQVSGW